MAHDEYRVPEAATDTDNAETAVTSAALKACMRIVDCTPTRADIEWLGKAFAAVLTNLGTVPLERCLHLPTTSTAWRKMSRDQWLCKAAILLDSSSAWGTAQDLKSQWDRFIQRGYWQQWRDDEHPPEIASNFNKALFYATRLNRSQGLTTKQISRIVGHCFRSKSP